MLKKSQKSKCLKIQVKGRVQGVYFRAWTQKAAKNLGLTGWVRNRADGSVEIEAEGKQEALETLLNQCHQGPVAASVQEVIPEWQDAKGKWQDFEILYGK